MPILASLDPRCERFSFRTLRIHFCSDCERYFAEVLNLRWVAWVILVHLHFLFIRLPSLWRCGLAETVFALTPIVRRLSSSLVSCVCVWTIWKDVKLLTCLMMCFNGFPICHCLFGFFIWFSNKSRGARPSVITLPNEAMSLKGKQLGTPSCVPADSF